MEELISVIIPIYNKEKYLRDCIESVISQTYRNLEIILINDGSTDHSQAICEKYVAIDGRIKLINTENRGAPLARNRGIELAEGNYISFIDADDYIARNYYKILYGLAKKHDAQITISEYIRIPEGEIYKFQENEEEITILDQRETLIELYGKSDDDHVRTVIMCNKLFDRKLFDHVRYIPGRVIDDETIIYRLIEESNTIVRTNQILYGYVQSQDSIMRKGFTKKRLEDSILVYNEIIEHFQNQPDLLGCVIKRAIFFYTQFLGFICQSDMIDKKSAIEQVEKNYQEKMKKLIELLPKLQVKIEAEELAKTYQSEKEKWNII